MKKKFIILTVILIVVFLTFAFVACNTPEDTAPDGGTSSGNISSGSIDSGENLPSGSIDSGDIGNGETSGSTVTIKENNMPPKKEYDDSGIDYSQAIIVENNIVTGLSDYGKTLPRIVIPDGVTGIETEAFKESENLESVVIPDSVKSIGARAFYGCSNLRSFEISKTTSQYSLCSVSLASEIAEGETSIGDEAFSLCINLTYIEIPSSLTSIGDNAFVFCSSLTSIELPSSVVSIGDDAFFLCSSLVIKYADAEMSSDLRDKLIYLGEYAEEEIGLANVNIPIVYNCKENEVADDGNIYVLADNGVQYALNNGKAKVSGHTDISGVIDIAGKVVYKEKEYNVNDMEPFAFCFCVNMTKIQMSGSVTSIGEGAFSECSSLTIYCEAESQPAGWDSDWNYDDIPVIWGYKGQW